MVLQLGSSADVICLQEVIEVIEVGIELQINGYDMFKPSVMKRGVITYINRDTNNAARTNRTV